MFEKIYEERTYEVYLLIEDETCYQIMLKNDYAIIAIYYVAKENGSIFGFYPIDYTYGNTDSYDKIINKAIKKLLSK